MYITYKNLYKTYKNLYKTYKHLYKTYKHIYKTYIKPSLSPSLAVYQPACLFCPPMVRTDMVQSDIVGTDSV